MSGTVFGGGNEHITSFGYEEDCDGNVEKDRIVGTCIAGRDKTRITVGKWLCDLLVPLYIPVGRGHGSSFANDRYT
jgi:hypothetical protein